MRIAITDSRIPKDAERALFGYADRTVKLPPCLGLQAPVASHPDMLLFLTESSIITSERYFSDNRKLFTELSVLSGRRVITDKAHPSPLYPADVKFNCFTLGSHLFGLTEALSEEIRTWAKENGIMLINTRQGYAKCSACIVSNDAVITEDASIEKAVRSCGFDILRISAGHAALDGYSCGFIGGACGTDRENIYFCGDISAHPDFESINKFCHRHGKSCISLGSDRLYDIGTIFFIDT